MISPAWLAVRTHRTLARRLSPAGPADPTTLPRSRRLSPAVPTGLNPRPGPLGGVPTGRMVNPRGQGQEAQSRWAGWSTPAARARKLSPAGQACGAPCSEAQSRRGAWSISVARARTMSPAVLDGRTHRPRAWRLSTAGPDGRPPQLGPVRSVPLGRLVNPRDPSPEAESRSAGWWSPAPGGRVPPGRLVEPRRPASGD